MKEHNIKGVLPPSFRAWYQLLRKIEKSHIEGGVKDDPITKVVWQERHPTAGLTQGYEFTLDFIKARVFDELRKDAADQIETIEKEVAASNGNFASYFRTQFIERFKIRYLSQ